MMPRGICRFTMVVLGQAYAMCGLPEGHQEDIRNTPNLEAMRWGGHRLMLTSGRWLNAPYACGHCGRPCGDLAGGYAVVPGNVRVCHPNEPDRPDCYRLITVYGEVVGVRLSEVVFKYVTRRVNP